jgi:Uma2 family endonuclease
MTITSLDQLDPNGTYTYADYLLWQFEERVELLRGKIRQMAAPNRRHQVVSRRIQYVLTTALLKSPCELYNAPFDVRLTRMRHDKEVKTVVQPDLCVICDPAKLDERGCNGAPDLIIEILSPGNSRTEMKDKFELYQEAGVLEYWIANPGEKMIQVFRLNEQGCYIGLPAVFEGDILTTPIVPNMEVDVAEVFLD